MDGLTGIKNRSAFDEDIKDKVTNFNRYPSVYLMYLDLNYFKMINDNYGHDTGDKALILFGKTLHNEAEAMNADAIIGVRYATSAIMAQAAEVLVYGTAVRFN